MRAAGWAWAAARNAASTSVTGVVSGFISSSQRPEARAAPTLTAPPKPTFSGNRSTVADGSDEAIASAEPSVDALSTTITSYGTVGLAARSLARHRRVNSRVWYETMTTLIRGSVTVCSDSARRHARRYG